MIYEITVWTDTYWSQTAEVTASSPDEALEKFKQEHKELSRHLGAGMYISITGQREVGNE